MSSIFVCFVYFLISILTTHLLTLRRVRGQIIWINRWVEICYSSTSVTLPKNWPFRVILKQYLINLLRYYYPYLKELRFFLLLTKTRVEKLHFFCTFCYTFCVSSVVYYISRFSQYFVLSDYVPPLFFTKEVVLRKCFGEVL